VAAQSPQVPEPEEVRFADLVGLPTPKVLVVNDNPASLTALESVLARPARRGGYQVVTARSGEEALRRVLGDEFAVIVLDVRMPVMDGFETAAAIHSHPRSAATPIIFVTAHQGDELHRLKGYQEGAVDYLFTPIIPEILLAKVAVFVELKKMNLQLRQQAEALALLNQDLRIQRVQDLERLNTELAAEVAERKKAQLREHELATRDPLTGLLNRRSLLEQLDHAVVNAARRREQFALLFLDLNKFKPINDALGHEVGDELLRQVAARLQDAVRGSDLVARLGGDEFVVLVEALSSSAMAARVAAKIAQSLAKPYQVGEHEVKTSASIGIGLYPQDGQSASCLVGKADKAMYHAKHKKDGGIQFFHEELNALELARTRFKQELQQALSNSELVLQFLPRRDIASGQLSALQALLYWQHPRLGLVAGRDFIAQADNTQLMQVAEWMLMAVSIQARAWADSGSVLGKLPLAIDVALPHVPSEMPQGILANLRKRKLPRGSLQLGVAESLLMRDADKVAGVLQEFRKAGVTLAVDNFGTGYSSLAFLKTLPLDLLKIDESLIQAMDGHPRDAALVGAVISLARALGLQVVAQGVATPRQLASLRSLGCHSYQGGLLSAPLSAPALEQWLRDSSTTLATTA
jgi:diguanylate cyclase (GGDEF)-like protein